MPITLNCPKCHKPFRVRDESIGGRVRCPSCGSVLQVPGNLSPASHFGDESRVEGGGPRPVAEDVPAGGSRPGAAPAARGDGAVDMNPPPAANMSGPPSIRAQAPVPARPPITLPPAPKRIEPARPSVRLPAGDDAGWGRVHGGLGMIRWALFLCALVFIAAAGHGVWIVLDTDNALKLGPGFLGKEDWPRWKELVVAYTAGPLALAAVLLFFGRLRCCRAPAEAHARGLAFGTFFFTLVGLLGIGLFIAMAGFHVEKDLNLPEVLRAQRGDFEFLGSNFKPTVAELTVLFAAIPAALLADVLTLLFVGQIGWPLNRPQLLKGVAGLFVYVAVVPAGILIGHLFYPAYDMALESWRQTGSPLGAGDDTELARRVMIWAVILLAAGLLFFLRYAGLVGGARRAIRRRLAGQS
jgi:predicted Zn finger-like uncharacterized protein